jgi:hypothetical protein
MDPSSVTEPTVWFSVDFFRNPPPGFTIEWHDGWLTDTTVDADDTVIRGGYCGMVHDHKPCHERCMAGVIVKLDDPPHIWVLTGGAQVSTFGSVTKLMGYEGKWPD